MLNDMTLIEASRQIDQNMINKLSFYNKDLEHIDAEIADVMADFKRAAAQGDFSENAAYKDAKEKLRKLQDGEKISILTIIEEIQNLKFNTGELVQHTEIKDGVVFRIRNVQDSSEVYTLKGYNTMITDMEEGIISVRATAYTRFLYRKKGDIVTLENHLTGENVKFEVIDLY